MSTHCEVVAETNQIQTHACKEAKKPPAKSTTKHIQAKAATAAATAAAAKDNDDYDDNAYAWMHVTIFAKENIITF